jgi:UDP-N-acetylmuramate dehydrogenase
LDAERFDRRVREIVGADRVRREAPLAPLTTFRVGGPADWLIDVHTADQVRDVQTAAREAGVPVMILGGGSNLLVADAGVRGAVLRLRLTAIEQPAPDRVTAEAGATINGLVRWCIARGLAGLEAWAGTPGTVGGAIAGNAHYGGRNIGDRVTSVLLATPEGQWRTADREAMDFAYDRSRIGRTREIVIRAEFAVAPGAPDALRATARASLAHRKATQPLALASAGCIFQNPDPAREAVPPGVPASAGALVDRAGFKGRRLGAVRVSATHANFFVNEGGATASDIRALIETARTAVREKFGVELRDEIVSVGEF